MNKPIKISIRRSYSEKRQLKQFEPIESSCEAMIEQEFDDPEEARKKMSEWSQNLDIFVQSEVNKTLQAKLTQKTVDKKKIKDSSLDSAENDISTDDGINDFGQ